MKAVLILLIVFTLSDLSLTRSIAADVRTVNNVPIDLQPLIDWTGKKKGERGERPLKHWKQLEILEFKRSSTYPVLLCDIEGARSEILLKNCPKELLDLLREKSALESQRAGARKDEAAAAEALGDASNKRQRKQANRSHSAAQKVEKAAGKDLTEINKRIKQQRIFAMNTGENSGGVPVWDTGLHGH